MSEKIAKRLRQEWSEHDLNDFEYNFLKELNLLLQFHINRQDIINNFLSYVVTTRLGYTSIREGYRLKYELKVEDEQATLIIKEVKA